MSHLDGAGDGTVRETGERLEPGVSRVTSEMVDRLEPRFEEVRMVGQAPFAGATLVEYGVSVKQYAGDVLVTLVPLLLAAVVGPAEEPALRACFDASAPVRA